MFKTWSSIDRVGCIALVFLVCAAFAIMIDTCVLAAHFDA